MSHPDSNDSIANLAESLTAEYNQATKAETHDALAELQQFVDQVPPKTEITAAPGIKYLMPIGALIMFGLSLLVLSKFGESKKDTGALIFALSCTVILVLVSYANRNAGKFVFMTLDHSHLRVHNLANPVNLLQVGRVTYKDGGWIQSLMLELGPDEPQNRNQKKLNFIMSKAVYLRPRGKQTIRIMSPGYRVNGKNLTDDQVMGLMETYLNVARAEVELKALRERQGGFV